MHVLRIAKKAPVLIKHIADLLKPNSGELYITTDVCELAIYMRDVVLNSGLFVYHEMHRTYGERYAWGHNSDPLLDSSSVEANYNKRLKTDYSSSANSNTISNCCDYSNNSTNNVDIGHQWLRIRPYFSGTERDHVCELKKDSKIYRMLFKTL